MLPFLSVLSLHFLIVKKHFLVSMALSIIRTQKMAGKSSLFQARTGSCLFLCVDKTYSYISSGKKMYVWNFNQVSSFI